jgi:hypothetical protein
MLGADRVVSDREVSDREVSDMVAGSAPAVRVEVTGSPAGLMSA